MLFQILLVHLAAIASPGPNVMLVAHTSLARSRRAGLWAAAGIATGALAWAAIVAGGLGVIAAAPATRTVLRIAGGLYLVVLGVRTFRSAHSPLAPAGAGSGTAGGDWARGVATNLSNPKAGVFYLSVFAAVIPASASWGLRVAAVAMVFANALAWHAVIALGMSAPGTRARYVRSRGRIDRVAGIVIATFGLLFATGLR